MEQQHRINVLIDGRSYKYNISSEEQEEALRKAAASVNDKIQRLSSSYKGVSPIDIVTIAALNEGIEKFQAENSRSSDSEGYAKISADLASYVESLK